MRGTPKKNKVEIHNSYEIRKSPLKAFEIIQPHSAAKLRIPTSLGEDKFKDAHYKKSMPENLLLKFQG